MCAWHVSHAQPRERQPCVSGGGRVLRAPADEARCVHMRRGVWAWHVSHAQPRVRHPHVSGGSNVNAPAAEAR
jgi:hypothetical protein